MAIIPAAPNDINDCKILCSLRKKSSEKDGIAAKVQQFISVASPMLDIVVAGPFRNYTLHNRDHAKKLIHLIGYLISEEVLNNLTTLDCLFIVYSSFLHDMGMALTSTERERTLKDQEFHDTIREWPELANSLKQARLRLTTISDDEKPFVESIIYQMHEAAMSSYLRPRHATHDRYIQLIEHLKKCANAPDLFCIRGVSFEAWLIDVCASHNLDAVVLCESKNVYEDRFPRDLTIAHEKVNLQFCAALLRLSDILDFDRERTPRVLFESLGISSSIIPGAKISLQEWEKHMAIHTIEIREDEVLVSAECHHPAIEKTINEFCLAIERELRDTVAILKRNPKEVVEHYAIELPLSVRPRINSVGYSYKDLSLRLNQSSIISLLMGDRLYSHSGVAFRELIQNSLDACAVRRRIQENGQYVPEIKISKIEDELGKTWFEISDNGIGMDEHVLSEYFLKIGDSYYDSSDFKRQFNKIKNGKASFCPISKFGIGILSVFMIADVLEVHTQSVFSPRSDSRGHFIRIERLGGLAFVAKSHRKTPGTLIRIRLRPEITKEYIEFVKKVSGYLRWLLLRPWFFIRIELEKEQYNFSVPKPDGAFYCVDSQGRDALIKKGYVPIVIELGRWSNLLSGVAVILLSKDENERLTTTIKGKQIIFQETFKNAIKPSSIIKEYKGNRLTVNGFQVKSFRTKRLLTFPSGIRFAFLVDMDATGSEDLEFDVSRDRLTKKGENFLREEFRATILTAFEEIGIMEQLKDEIKLSIPIIPFSIRELRSRLSDNESRPDALKDLFNAVKELIPEEPWPKGLHLQIGSKLGVSPKLTSRVISKLIATGMVSRSKKDNVVDFNKL